MSYYVECAHLTGPIGHKWVDMKDDSGFVLGRKRVTFRRGPKCGHEASVSYPIGEGRYSARCSDHTPGKVGY